MYRIISPNGNTYTIKAENNKIEIQLPKTMKTQNNSVGLSIDELGSILDTVISLYEK